MNEDIVLVDTGDGIGRMTFNIKIRLTRKEIARIVKEETSLNTLEGKPTYGSAPKIVRDYLKSALLSSIPKEGKDVRDSD